MVKKFIQTAIKRPGALHRALGVPQGTKIPPAKIAAKRSMLERKREGGAKLSASESRLLRQINLAKTLSGLRRKKQRAGV